MINEFNTEIQRRSAAPYVRKNASARGERLTG
jgi:hypothetical protein